MDGIIGRIKDDVSNTALSNWLVIKSLFDFVDFAEHCSENITILKCTKKNVLSIAKPLDKDTSGCVLVYLVPTKCIVLKFFYPYMIETKEHHYSIKALSQHIFKSSRRDIPDSSAVDHQYQNIENNESVLQGQWLLVGYEKEFFLGIVLSLLTSSALVGCLENLFGLF